MTKSGQNSFQFCAALPRERSHTHARKNWWSTVLSDASLLLINEKIISFLVEVHACLVSWLQKLTVLGPSEGGGFRGKVLESGETE